MGTKMVLMTKYLILFAALAFLGAGVLAANPKEEAIRKEKEWNSVVAGLAKGQAFAFGRDEIVFLPNLTLVKGGAAGKPLQAGKSPDSRWKVGQFSVVRKDSLQTRNATPGSAAGVVGLNTRTNRFVLITGSIIVEFSGSFDLDAVTAKYALGVVRVFPHLNTAIVSVKNIHEVATMAASIATEPGVLSAQPEVIERFATPR